MPELVLFTIGCAITTLVAWGLFEIGKLERRRARLEQGATRPRPVSLARVVQLTPRRVA